MGDIKIAVIGAGPMGLMCAYALLKKGCDVTVFEQDNRIGGMTAALDFAGTKIERFYHFICKTDYHYFDLLRELNLYDHLKWKNTQMGYYYEGKLFPWGSPIHLLKFPKLGWVLKLRYALMVWTTLRINDWTTLDKINVTKWLVKWLGKKGYEKLWENLFYYKFYQHKDKLSAAWLGTRIKRVGKSRRSIFQESLGYLQGGSETLLATLEAKINELGGKIILEASVEEILSKNGVVEGAKINNQLLNFDKVVSTIPLPYVPKIVPTLSNVTKKQINNIHNVGVVCVLFKLSQSFSSYFWINIKDKRKEIPGLIEYSNLNAGMKENETIIYVPYYMPHDHSRYQLTDEAFLAETIRYFKIMRSDFSEKWILASKVTRYNYAQTVCTTNFFKKLPPMKSEIKNFYMADTAYYYPEDRSISESIYTGNQLA